MWYIVFSTIGQLEELHILAFTSHFVSWNHGAAEEVDILIIVEMVGKCHGSVPVVGVKYAATAIVGEVVFFQETISYTLY